MKSNFETITISIIWDVYSGEIFFDSRILFESQTVDCSQRQVCSASLPSYLTSAVNNPHHQSTDLALTMPRTSFRLVVFLMWQVALR